jgi:hypothetical protein
LLDWGVGPTVKVNAALALVASAGAIILLQRPTVLRRRAAIGICLLISSLATLTVLEWIFGRALGIDQFFMHVSSSAQASGRPAPYPAAAIALLTAATAASQLNSPHGVSIHRLLSGAFLGTVLLAVLGWVYGAGELSHSGIPAVSLPALTALIMLGVALFLQPGDRLIYLFRGNSASAQMMRRLGPCALILPPLLGEIRIIGVKLGWFGVQFGLAMFANLMVFAALLLIVATARALNREDKRRLSGEKEARKVQAQLQAILDHLPSSMYLRDLDERYELVN